MLPVFRNVILNVTRRAAVQLNMLTSSFHVLTKPNLNQLIPASQLPQNNFLVPVIQNFVPSCGFKVKGRVKRRCKDCYIVRRNERLFVLCRTHPRHKQMSMVKDPKHTWILSHATQSKVRPW